MQKCKIMGVLNITPDSFSDGGEFLNVDSALKQAEKMIEEGADIIDIGGESTRPGAKVVELQQELDRVIPVIEKSKNNFSIDISIDTYKPEVMQAAVKSGATLINDVCALQQPAAIEVAAKLNVPVILMHMQGDPQTMQNNPQYNNLINGITVFFQERIQSCLDAGIKAKNIIIDPGFGFGKTVEHNLQLINAIPTFKQLGYPVLIGFSRKATLGHLLDKPEKQRLYGACALSAISIERGADIIRTHDVAATKDVLKVISALNKPAQTMLI